MKNIARFRQLFGLLFVVLLLSACGSRSDTQVVQAMEPEPEDQPAAEPIAAPTAQVTPEPEPTVAPAEPEFALTGEIGLTVVELNDMVAFVEESTGREFLRPPVIVAQHEAEYEESLQVSDTDLADFEAAVDGDIRMMQAMGITKLGVASARDAWLELMTSTDGILGRYDINADVVYVPIADEVDDTFRSIVVHELTHALDGQHVDLVAYTERIAAASEARSYDTVFALTSILEGRASSVQFRWEQANGVVPSAELPAGIEDIPPAAVLAVSLPYQFGLQYIEANGGPSQTWDLYDNGPITSEALITIATDEDGSDVLPPAAEGTIISSGPFGAIDMMLMLIGDSLNPSPAAAIPVVTAADGWAGGYMVVWGDSSESCVRVALAADSAADLNEIEGVFSTWVSGVADSRKISVSDDAVEVTGCAPYLP